MRRPAEPNEARSAAPARPAASATAPTRTPPARTPEQRRQADDVYNFLSSFTAGVQRGLEEATHDERPAPGEPHPDDPRWR
jgi:hypothetical protein